MGKRSAGILMYRTFERELQVLLGHPGGPTWTNRDQGAWTLPKGEIHPGEEPLQAAIREFQEETSLTPDGPFTSLGSVIQKSGKEVWGWASKGDADVTKLFSNTIEVQWPKGSGRVLTIPEIDRFGWFSVAVASEKMNPAQVDFVTRLVKLLT